MLNQVSPFQFSYGESHFHMGFVDLSGKSELRFSLECYRGETRILHTESARVTFWLCFTSTLNCLSFSESSIVRHTSRKDVPLYHFKYARAPATLPDVFKYALSLS